MSKVFSGINAVNISVENNIELTNIVPTINSFYTLGDESYEWNKIYTARITTQFINPDQDRQLDIFYNSSTENIIKLFNGTTNYGNISTNSGLKLGYNESTTSNIIIDENYVGIGITNPSELLHVNGTMRAGYAYIQATTPQVSLTDGTFSSGFSMDSTTHELNFNTHTNAYAINLLGTYSFSSTSVSLPNTVYSGNILSTSLSESQIKDTTSGNYLYMNPTPSTYISIGGYHATNGTIPVAINGTSTLYVDSTGNTGFGLTVPGQKIEVNGNIALGHRWDGAVTTTDVLIGKSNSGSLSVGGSASILFKDRDNVDNDAGTYIGFYPHGWSQPRTEKLRITHNSVMINTTNSLWDFITFGTAHFGDSIDNTEYGMVQITRPSSQGDTKHHLSFVSNGAKVAGLGFVQDSTTLNLTNDGSSTSTNGIAIDLSGNIGINDLTPSYKLDVNGDIRTTGTLYVDYGAGSAQQILLQRDVGSYAASIGVTDQRIIIANGSGASNSGIDLCTNQMNAIRFYQDGSRLLPTFKIQPIDPDFLEPFASIVADFGNYDCADTSVNIVSKNPGNSSLNFVRYTTNKHSWKLDDDILRLYSNDASTAVLTIPADGSYFRSEQTLEVKANGPTLKLAGTDHTFIEFYKDDTTRSAYLGYPSGASNTVVLRNDVSGGGILFLLGGYSAINILSDGNVGIGRTPSGYRLDVSGDIRSTNISTGNITASGTLDTSLLNVTDIENEGYVYSNIINSYDTRKINVFTTYPTTNITYGSGYDNETVGWSFTVAGSNILLTHMGVHLSTLGGALGTQTIGLWTSGGSLITSFTIDNTYPAETTSSGKVYYRELSTPIVLSASTTYVIGATVDAGIWYKTGSDYTLTSVVTNNGSVRNGNGNGFGFPSTTISATEVFATTFKYINATTVIDDAIKISNVNNIGLSRDAITNKLEVEGNASKTTSGSWLANSDARIKKDVTVITGTTGLNNINNLRPVEFKYTSAYLEQHPSIVDKVYKNFIAQEFEVLFPNESYITNEYCIGSGTKESPEISNIKQIDVHPVLINLVAAVQELNTKVTNLNNTINSLELRISTLENQ